MDLKCGVLLCHFSCVGVVSWILVPLVRCLEFALRLVNGDSRTRYDLEAGKDGKIYS